MHYSCGIGHMGAVRECWHEGSRSGYILCVLLQKTNHVKHIMKSLIVGTTSIYIGRVRNCATNCPRMPSYWQLLSEKRIEHLCIMAYLGLFDYLVCYVVMLNV